MLSRVLSPAPWLGKTLAAAMLLMIGLCGPLAAQGTPESQSDAPSPTLARVFAAWKARQERIKSFYFAWNVRVMLPKGFEFPYMHGLAGVQTWNVAIEDDLGFTIPQSEWSGEGLDRLRSDFSEFVYNAPDGWKETGRFRITRNGSMNSRLQVPTSSGGAPTIAIWRRVPIKNPSNWSSSGDFLLQNLDLDLVPLRLAVRPLGPATNWTPENCRVVSEDALLGKVHCIKLQMEKMDHSEQCWIDPNRDYSVVRWERRQQATAPLNIAIDVEQGVDHEWLPARWTWKFSTEATAQVASLEATVTRRAVNKKLGQSTFAADYPPRTRVYDASVELPIVESDDHSGMLPSEEARPILNAIADAWLKRQSKAQRFKYVWRRDGVRNTINTVCVDGEKFMTEYQTPDWAPSTKSSASQTKRSRLGREEGSIHEMKTVFDGVDTRDLSFVDHPRWPGPHVNISAGSSVQRTGGLPGDRYLFLVFRPFDPIFKGRSIADLRDPTLFRVRKQKGKIGDVACVVLETEPHPGMHLSYWLDPARAYIPLREHRTLNGEDRDRVDFSYRSDPTCGWVPVGWTEANVGMGGALLFPNTDTITEFTINQPIPGSDFQIDVPRGANINDGRMDRRPEREKAAERAFDAKRNAVLATNTAKEKAHPELKSKLVFDRFADVTADVEAAFKRARETNKRVLILFGANWSVDSGVLGVVLKESADVSAALKKDFVLVLVDIDTDSGKRFREKYVPERQRRSIPHLAVLDPTGKVLGNDDTKALEVDDDYSVPKLKAFLAEWAQSK